MGIFEILLIGIGLAMDAFAVSICKGLSMKKMNWKNAIIIALYFGVFQALMPLIGYFLGMTFESIVTTFDHWVAFALLTLIGGGMIKESFDSEDEKKNDRVDFKTMVVLAIATSIDALAVGISLAALDRPIVESAAIIGVVTFVISIIGVYIGKFFGNRYKKRAELTGGIILVLIGVKILCEHMGWIAF